MKELLVVNTAQYIKQTDKSPWYVKTKVLFSLERKQKNRHRADVNHIA